MDQNRGGRRHYQDRTPADQQWQEQVISVDRVARVQKGGRRFRFRTLVAVGDGKTKVGIGVAKGADVQASVTKAVAVAKRNLVTFPITKGSIPHQITARYGGAKVMLKPAAPGSGVIAGGVVRSVLDVTGIQNILSKSLGSNNKINNAYATVAALTLLVPRKDWITTETVKDKPTPAKSTSVKKSKMPAKPKVVKAAKAGVRA